MARSIEPPVCGVGGSAISLPRPPPKPATEHAPVLVDLSAITGNRSSLALQTGCF